MYSKFKKTCIFVMHNFFTFLKKCVSFLSKWNPNQQNWLQNYSVCLKHLWLVTKRLFVQEKKNSGNVLREMREKNLFCSVKPLNSFERPQDQIFTFAIKWIQNRAEAVDVSPFKGLGWYFNVHLHFIAKNWVRSLTLLMPMWLKKKEFIISIAYFSLA